MALVTPGLAFLGRALLSLAFPCAIIATIRFILNDHFGLSISTWSLAAGIAIGVPLMMAVRIGIDEVTQRRRAAALGARIAPRIQGKWPGNLDILRTMLKISREGYPGRYSSHLFCGTEI